MSNDPFKWSAPPRGSAPVNSLCIEHDNVNHPRALHGGRDRVHRCHCGRIDVPERPDASMADGTGAQVYVALAAEKRQGRSAKGEILS